MDQANVFGLDGIFTAITQTQLENNFFVKMTHCPEESLKYLVSLSHHIQEKFKVRIDIYFFSFLLVF